VRQQAWLTATPRDAKGKTKPTRLQTLKKNGKEPRFPPSPPCMYLVGYLFEVGPVTATGMGAAPVTHAELLAWQHNTGIELTAWEASTLHLLSLAFLAATQAAEDPACKPPFADPDSVQQLRTAELEQKLDTFLN
jgi:hypothetical protein